MKGMLITESEEKVIGKQLFVKPLKVLKVGTHSVDLWSSVVRLHVIPKVRVIRLTGVVIYGGALASLKTLQR